MSNCCRSQYLRLSMHACQSALSPCQHGQDLMACSCNRVAPPCNTNVSGQFQRGVCGGQPPCMTRMRARSSSCSPHMFLSSQLLLRYSLSQIWYGEANPVRREHAYAVNHHGVVCDLTAAERVDMRRQLTLICWESYWQSTTILTFWIVGSYIAYEACMRWL